MFRAGLLLIMRRIKSVETATGTALPSADWLLASSNLWTQKYLAPNYKIYSPRHPGAKGA
jgi:hypothetical protein